MYLGQVNTRGFVEMLKGIIRMMVRDCQATFVNLEFDKDLGAKISYDNHSEFIENNWGTINTRSHPFSIEYCVVNALSERFTMTFRNDLNEVIQIQKYERGILTSGEQAERISCSSVEVDFSLDRGIWRNDFQWNLTFIIQHLQELAFLYKGVTFSIEYEESNEASRIVYHFEKGLENRIELEILNGLGGCYFKNYIDKKIGGCQFEIAYAFRNYDVDQPFIRSYVNDYYTPDGGTHVDGILKGITYGVMKYFQKHNLTEVYRISEKGIKDHLVCFVNIRMHAPIFSGCVKNKLANSEIIEPLASYVSEQLFGRIENDSESTEKLIRKFKI
ncbi:MAG: hypothetical protein AAFO03_26875 [Bacteroidota bacterium]